MSDTEHARDGESPHGPRPDSAAQSPPDSQSTDRLTKSSQWSNWTVLAMIILCFFVIVTFRPFDQFRAPTGGQKLSQLSLLPLTGESRPVDLGDLTGKVVLLNFWGTWCPPCREELPHIAALDVRFGEHPAFELLAVSCGPGYEEDIADLRENTAALLEKMNLALPTYADPGGLSRSAVDQAAGLEGYPTTLIIDRLGQIRRVWDGYRPGSEKEMEDLISQLLSEG